jgi:DNA polymerase III delta prime subunit
MFDGLWIEKYRPTKLDDMCISQEIKTLINSWNGNIPHLLFLGKAGVGKTTLARILVQDILKCDYLYINASDENGIDTIRYKVTGFVQTKSLDGNLKVVILDEADGLTIDGQKCLRNLMESYANSARFILTGNVKHKINVALQSRCQNIDIQPSFKEAVIRCLNILKLENVQTNPDQKKQIVELVKRYFPDLRKCIGEIQKHCINGTITLHSKINNTGLCVKIFDNIKNKKCLDIRKFLIENDGDFHSDWDQLLVDLLNYIYEQPIDDLVKKQMIIIIADHLDKSTRVIDKEINLFACLLNLEEI